MISWRDRGNWRSRVETAASNGAFTSAFGIRRPSAAVAQWIGDDTRRHGDQGDPGAAAEAAVRAARPQPVAPRFDPHKAPRGRG